MITPTATYRIQFSPFFGFQAVNLVSLFGGFGHIRRFWGQVCSWLMVGLARSPPLSASSSCRLRPLLHVRGRAVRQDRWQRFTQDYSFLFCIPLWKQFFRILGALMKIEIILDVDANAVARKARESPQRRVWFQSGNLSCRRPL